MKRTLVCAVALFQAACGGTGQPADAPSDGSGAASTGSEHSAVGIPESCMKRMGACMPPISWAENLCKEVYPDLALYMFRDGTPWTRFYMRTGLNAVNGWGPTVDEDLVTSEEVIVINHRLKKYSLDVEGSAGTYDVLRWNGGCVTLDVNEVTNRKPPRPMHSKLNWRYLSDDMQESLRRDAEVTEVYRARRKECKGVNLGKVSAKCVELDKRLGDVIAEYVRRTPDLPEPKFHP